MNDNENPPVEETADTQAEKAFDDMTAREHRHMATDLTVCPTHGAVAVLAGMPTGNVSAVKVTNLQTAKERLTEALKHIDAALTLYQTSEG